MSDHLVKLGDCVKQYRTEVWVDDSKNYGQVTVSGTGTISHRGTKFGGNIGRKRQFVLDLKTHPNTLIFTRQGIYDGAIGFAPPDTDGCIVTENMPMFSLKSGISREYMEQLLLSSVFKSEVKKLAPKGAAQKSIHERELLEVAVPLPPLDKQVAIADSVAEKRQVIGTVQKEITYQETLLAKLQQSILQEAIQGKLTADWRSAHPDVEPASQLLRRIQAEKARLIAAKKLRPEKPLPNITPAEIPFAIPQGWEWCRLDRMAMDVSYGTSQKAHLEAEGIPVLRMGNITSNGELSYSNLKYVSPKIKDLPRLYLESGDIVFNRTNSYELVGKSAVYRRDEPFTLASYLIRVRLYEKLVPEFVAYFINSAICRTEFIEPDVIQQNGQANFNGTKLKTIPIPLPPLAEQVAIVARVEVYMKTCREMEAEIEHARTHAAHLLQAVLKEAFAPAA